MQGYIIDIKPVKDDDLIVSILTENELLTTYRFYGARHSNINIGYKIELENLIKNEVLVEIEDYIDELFEIIAVKKEDDEIKEELKQMQEMKKDFEEMLADLVHGDIDDEEAKEIIDEINEMRKED